MSRIFAVLLLVSHWPLAATAELHRAHVPDWDPSIERLAPGFPGGTLPATGGWDLLSRPNPVGAERDGRTRPLLDTDGMLGAEIAPVPPLAAVPRADDARLDQGALLIRYEHLPYFATAPPSSR
jgi:hypothetical protein